MTRNFLDVLNLHITFLYVKRKYMNEGKILDTKSKQAEVKGTSHPLL